MGRISMAMTLGAAVLALGAAGCGGNDTTNSNTSATKPADTKQKGTVLALAADPNGQFKYDKSALEAKAGNVTIEFVNKSQTPHNVAVAVEGEKDLGVSDDVAAGSTSLSLQNVAPGAYTFYCTLPGHRAGGMEGTLTVK